MAEHFHFIWLSQLLQTLQKSGGVAVVAAERIAAIAADDVGRDHLIERIESRNGVHTIESAAALGYGSREYELVEVE